MADIAKLLARASGKWTQTEVRERGLLPAGRYQFKLDHVKGKSVVVEDTDHVIRARVVLEVITGPDEKRVGARVTKSWNLLSAEGEPDEMGFSILKSELAACGVDVAAIDASEIPGTIEGLIGSIVDAQVVTKTGEDGTERQNIYINGLAKRAAAAPGGKAPAGKRRV